MVIFGSSPPRKGLAVTLTACIALHRSAPCTAWHAHGMPCGCPSGLSCTAWPQRAYNGEHPECAPRMGIRESYPVSATPCVLPVRTLVSTVVSTRCAEPIAGPTGRKAVNRAARVCACVCACMSVRVCVCACVGGGGWVRWCHSCGHVCGCG